MNVEAMAVSVSELNRYIKEKIAGDEALTNIIVKGEISNFKHHYTGHLYFTLKDENSLIKCIMFKTYAVKLPFTPKDGMKVFIFGGVSVFERDGVYQIYVKAIQEDGVGALYQQYEERKERLEKEGLFDQEKKKKIPLMPKVVGILTSQTGSVIRDIINVSTRRNPNIHLRLYPVPVQGEGAAEKIARGIQIMNEEQLADVLILARGGGSLEDLWPFNEELVARAISSSQIPIISAVGHETDFSISDFVADLRAPTPSAAAELAVPDTFEMKQKINGYENRCRQALTKQVQLLRYRYEKCMASRVFKEPLRPIQDEYIKIDTLIKRLETQIQKKQQQEQEKFGKLVAKLDTLSPLKTLSRGYAILEKNNKVIKSVSELKTGNKITIQIIDGKKEAQIL